jgi:hypothetical protein
MINQSYQGTPTSRRSPLTSLDTIVAGDPVLVGAMSGVSLDTAADLPAGTPTILFGGSFALTVVAKSSVSPGVNAAVNPGDAIYADGGTLDSASNITTGFTLNKNTAGVLFGYLDPTGPGILAGQTNTAAVVVLPRGM